jgi:hypothetical protein
MACKNMQIAFSDFRSDKNTQNLQAFSRGNDIFKLHKVF